MALDKLSTELDAKIASHLVGDIRSLSALSKVSKYYRTVAEPYLYNDIVVVNNASWRSWCLLRTIFDRSAVALHIKRLVLTDVVPNDDNGLKNAHNRDDDKISREILAMASTISDHVQQILGQFMHNASGVELACDWMKHLFARQWTKCLPSLITCLARDLEALTVILSYTNQTTLRRLITLPWSGAERPFWKLKEASFPGEESFNLHIDIYLRLEIMKFEFWRNELPAWPLSLPSGSIPSLTTISLECFKMTPGDIETIVSSPLSVNVKKLSLDHRDTLDRIQHGPTWNFAQFVSVLEEHLPQIEELTWTGLGNLEECTELADFRNLRKLRSLCLGYAALTPQRGSIPRALLEPHLVFPTGVRDFTVDHIRVKDIDKICDDLQVILDKSGDRGQTTSTALSAVLSQFSLKRFRLNIADGRISTPTALFLRQIADEMFKLGVEMKVQLMPVY